MPTTANGLKATRLRGHNGRMYFVEDPRSKRVDAIEVRPGVRIEDVDSLKRPGSIYHQHAWIVRHDNVTFPGWYVRYPGNMYGPVGSKADALTHLRAEVQEVADTNAYQW